MRRRALLAPLVLALAACGGEPAWEWRTPATVDAAALLEHLRPRGAEALVLANFWATW